MYSQVTGLEPQSARELEEQSLNFNFADSLSNQDILLQSQNSQTFQQALLQSQRMLEQAQAETRMMQEQLDSHRSDIDQMPLKLPGKHTYTH